MKVYKMHTADEFKLFDQKVQSELIIVTASPWNPPEVVLAPDEGGPPRILGDYSALITLPVFSQKAVVALGNILEKDGKLLPLRCEEIDTPFYGYHVTRLVDVDERKSEIRKNQLGNIVWIEKPVFIPDLLKDVYLFNVRQCPTQVPHVTDQFVQRVHELGLTGFFFREIWSDEE